VPADRLLAETDSPYLAPQPVRGQRNEPAHVLHTLATLADVRGDDPDGLGARIEANAARLFALP
jgi:TatD DNase family protein